MKTLTLEIDEQTYPSLMAFLQRLPADRYAVFEEADVMTEAQQQALRSIRDRLASGDDSDFEDWSEVRRHL